VNWQDSHRKMYWEIHEQGEIIARRIDELASEVAAIVEASNAGRFTSVQQIGCGDSHFVGWATKLAFQKLAGLPLTPAEAYEFAAYDVDGLSDTALVVGVSVSGKVGNTITAVERARERGMFSLAVTNTPESVITKAAEQAIVVGVDSPGSAPVPGTLTYLGSLTTLYLLAIELGKARGHLPARAADEYREILKQVHLSLRKIALTDFPLVKGYAQRHFFESPIVYFVGGGPNYGTALFGRAKLLEAAPVPCMAQEVEEWAHLEYFLTGYDTQVIFLVSTGPSRERVLDMMRTVNRVNGHVIAVVDPADDEVKGLAHEIWPVPPQEEMFSPIAFSVPLDILAYGAMVTQGSAPFRLDSSGNSGVIYKDEGSALD
jgi:glucosamine--fructose-6-phosphate aminotransferase (isomerizing)